MPRVLEARAWIQIFNIQTLTKAAGARAKLETEVTFGGYDVETKQSESSLIILSQS